MSRRERSFRSDTFSWQRSPAPKRTRMEGSIRMQQSAPASLPTTPSSEREGSTRTRKRKKKRRAGPQRKVSSGEAAEPLSRDLEPAVTEPQTREGSRSSRSSGQAHAAHPDQLQSQRSEEDPSFMQPSRRYVQIPGSRRPPLLDAHGRPIVDVSRGSPHPMGSATGDVVRLGGIQSREPSPRSHIPSGAEGGRGSPQTALPSIMYIDLTQQEPSPPPRLHTTPDRGSLHWDDAQQTRPSSSPQPLMRTSGPPFVRLPFSAPQQSPQAAQVFPSADNVTIVPPHPLLPPGLSGIRPPVVAPQQSQPAAQVFPNADTPNETIIPAHPSFHPQMAPAPSSMSTRLTFSDGKGRRDSTEVAVKKINDRLDAIIDDLALTGKFVPQDVVRDFSRKLLREANYARYQIREKDIAVMEKYSKVHGRIAQLIQIFCWMNPITTLYELQRSLVSVEQVATFEELRMGPLIKHPAAAKFFQPPEDLREVPEITAHQIQKVLMKFLDKKGRTRGERHSLPDFLEFFAKTLSKPSPHHLCIRITSFPLAIQTNYAFRRMHKQSRDRVQGKVDEEIKTIVAHEVEQVRRKLSSFSDIRSSKVALREPTTLLADIFSLFESYLPGYQSAKINAFLQLICHQDRVKQLFLLAVYVGAYGIERLTREEVQNRETYGVPQYAPQPVCHYRAHGEILDVLLPLLKRQPYPVSLCSLSEVEKVVVKTFGIPSFSSLSQTFFLDFVVSDEKCRAALGNSLTIGASAPDDTERKRVVEIVSQLRPTERNQTEVVSEALKLQFGVTAVEQICCGSVDKIVSDVNEIPKLNSASQSCITYLSPLLLNGATSDSHMQSSSQTLGALGNKSREDALSCLCRAPLLENLAIWSHWDQVFKPQHGDLAKFIQRDGPGVGLHVLELFSGILLKVDPQATHQRFLEAVEARDPVGTSGQLVSIVVQQGSVHELSLQLLGSHIQTTLERMVCDSAHAADDHTMLPAQQFIYQCLIRIPLHLCQFLAKEVFLEPLRRAASSAAVEALLGLSHSGAIGDKQARRHFQSLGMCLGIKAWTDDFSTMLEDKQSPQVLPTSRQPTSTHAMADGYELPISRDDPEEGTAVPMDVEPTCTHQEEYEDHVESVPVTATVAADPETEAKCRRVIESIRSEDFGVGLELEGRQKEVAHKQRQREGRGLQRLSKELYSKDTHFVLELIQNADDNHYEKSLLLASAVEVPAIKFIISSSSVTVLNNEVGFSEKNIRAICDVGSSTKGAHHSGYIGQKGIGFKSVFRITDTPEIHSGGYHIKFDAKCDAIGYILPHWLEEQDRRNAEIQERWNTTIVLPLKEDQLAMSLVRKFHDVQPSLLLFLHRLRSITVEHKESGVTRFMSRSDGSEGIIQIEHNTDEGVTEQDRWLVVRKHLTNASQFKTEVEVTEVALAFPLSTDKKAVVLAKDLQQQQVFAFLPLRSYGFRFIVQGDFDLPSSREDVNSDSVWNQLIRDAIPQLFLNALEMIKRLRGISVTDAVAQYLQFIPLDGELHDFFRPVAIRIRNLLRGASCLPTEPASEEVSDPFSIVQSLSCTKTEPVAGASPLWKQPSELVVTSSGFIQKVIPQSLLNSSLHYYYLNHELAPFLNPALQDHLGLHSLSIDHLVTVAEAVVQSYSSTSNSVIMLSDDSEDALSDEDDDSSLRSRGRVNSHTMFVQWVAQWLACVHTLLEEDSDRSPVTVGKLKKTRIIPLTNGAQVAAEDGSLFFPFDGASVSPGVFKCLFDEIMVVDTQLFDAEVKQEGTTMIKTSHRVHSVLELLGVREMYPAEIIRHHILPCFQSNQWKTKSADLLTTYLVYIKDSLGVQGSGITETEAVSLLRDCVALVTKTHGVVQPAKDVVHLSSQFQPMYDLEKLFPDMEWKLVHPSYLKKFAAQNAAVSWRNFLLRLGVKDRLTVGSFTENIPEGHSRWQDLRGFVGRSPDGAYTLRDYRCSEFEAIVKSAKTSQKQSAHQQMLQLLNLLDALWDQEYRQFSFAKCYDGSNENYLGGDKSIPSAFQQALTDFSWLPGTPLAIQSSSDQLYKGCELFDPSKANKRLLDCHVPYVACKIKNPKLIELLQVKCQVNANEVIGFLQEWSKAASTSGYQFCASISHMTEVYLFLYQQSQQMYDTGHVGENISTVLSSGEQSLIFVPDVYDSTRPPTEMVRGQFYTVHNVCWVDPSTVLYSQQKHNVKKIPSNLPKILQLHYSCEEHGNQRYQELKLAFASFGVRETPTAAAYISTLQFISSLAAIPEKHHINDFSSVALHLSQVCMNGDINPMFLQQQLKGKNVFPSHRDLWVSSDSCLLENDDPQLKKVFSECKEVHFLRWPETIHRKGPRHRQSEEQQREEERKHFVDVCNIAKLSEVVQSRIVPEGNVMPLEDLRRRLHVMVPLIQRYLVANEEDLYKALQQENLKEKLDKLFIGSVLSLKCIYSIQHCGVTYTSPHHSSPGSDFTDSTEDSRTAALYVVASKVSSPKVLVPTLAKIFTGKHGIFMDQVLFENLVKDMLLSPVEEMEGVLSDENYTFGEVQAGDTWVVPYQEEQEASESESEEEMGFSGGTTSPEHEKMEVGGSDRPQEEEKDTIRSWPPKAPASVGGFSSKYPARPPPPGSAVADTVSEEDIQKISEKYDLKQREVAKLDSKLDESRKATTVSSLGERQANQDDRVGLKFQGQPREIAPRNESSEQRNNQQNGAKNVVGTEPGFVDNEGKKQGGKEDTQEQGQRGRKDAREKGQKWNETLNPDSALFPDKSFSVAAALQPVAVESAESFLNRSFFDSCDQDSQERIGQWGEEYVYKYLRAVDSLPSGQKIKSVTWINGDMETGKPYDIEVQIEPQALIYIEVKTTKSSKKEFMEFSWNELQFAHKEKDKYQLYRVYNAGSELVTLRWMQNLSSILTTRPVRLFLEI